MSAHQPVEAHVTAQGLPPGGPLYLRVRRWVEQMTRDGALRPGDGLPSEREMAQRIGVSRVTVRRALQELVGEGRLVQRQGSGTFVAQRPQRLEQPLSHLTSFAEDMARRGLDVRSEWLERDVRPPSPDETVMLALSPGDLVARLARLRFANDAPLAIERAAIVATLLPNPDAVGASLYAHLEARGCRPVRAIQRIRAAALTAVEARLLEVGAGSPALQIERIGYLAGGRAVEFTRSVYRGDAYDFVAELKPGEGAYT